MSRCWQKYKTTRPDSQPDLYGLYWRCTDLPQLKVRCTGTRNKQEPTHFHHTEAALKGKYCSGKVHAQTLSCVKRSIWPRLYLDPSRGEMAKWKILLEKSIGQRLLVWDLCKRTFPATLPSTPPGFKAATPLNTAQKGASIGGFSSTFHATKGVSEVHRISESKKTQDQVHWRKFMSCAKPFHVPNKLIWKECTDFGQL